MRDLFCLCNLAPYRSNVPMSAFFLPMGTNHLGFLGEKKKGKKEEKKEKEKNNGSIHDESVAEILKAKKEMTALNSNDLFNLMAALEAEGKGTHKHENHWGILDQIIVSVPLLQRKNGLQILNQKAVIFEGSFLIQEEDKRLGTRPFRTYYGAQYLGGYSDHLPIYLDLVY